MSSPTSWVARAECARADGWHERSVPALRWAACQYAAQHHRDVLDAWVIEIIRRRVAALRLRWPDASPNVVTILDRLARWRADPAEAREIRVDAYAFYLSTAGAPAASDAYDVACDAWAYSGVSDAVASRCAFDAEIAGAAAIGASAATRYEMLLDLARRLDHVAGGGP